jgi:hypothetical protein
MDKVVIQQDAPDSMEELTLTMRKHIIVFLSLKKG